MLPAHTFLSTKISRFRFKTRCEPLPRLGESEFLSFQKLRSEFCLHQQQIVIKFIP